MIRAFINRSLYCDRSLTYHRLFTMTDHSLLALHIAAVGHILIPVRKVGHLQLEAVHFMVDHVLVLLLDYKIVDHVLVIVLGYKIVDHVLVIVLDHKIVDHLLVIVLDYNIVDHVLVIVLDHKIIDHLLVIVLD